MRQPLAECVDSSSYISTLLDSSSYIFLLDSSSYISTLLDSSIYISLYWIPAATSLFTRFQ